MGRLAACARTRAQLLTPRELEVLSYLAKGLAKKEIARITDLSVKTVEQHCTHLMQKLDIHDRVELARFAIREGLVQP
ncbi:MAG: LuxR C-terminal-related transcriptional regulator [Chromatiaceae bacterium]